MGILSIGTFIPAELKFLGWETSTIAFLVGMATLFELFRMVVGYLGDTYPILGSFRQSYITIGFALETIGFLLIAYTIGSYIILVGMIFFTVGSAIVSTYIDVYLIESTDSTGRTKTAASTQFFRLSGFAVGGILGAFFYASLGFHNFILFLGLINAAVMAMVIYLVKESAEVGWVKKDNLTHLSFQSKISVIKRELRDSKIVGMTLFLLIYPIGLFAQDAILEPYAIEVFGFGEEGIGRLAAIWGTSTLLFIPLAIVAIQFLGRLPTAVLGTMTAGFGLTLIAFLPELGVLDQMWLLLAVAVFGMGLGLMTTPATAMMFETANNSEVRTLLIAYYGLLVTLSRALASFLAGFVMLIASYQTVFVLETVVLLSSIIPLFIVRAGLKAELGIEDTTKPVRGLEVQS